MTDLVADGWYPGLEALHVCPAGVELVTALVDARTGHLALVVTEKAPGGDVDVLAGHAFTRAVPHPAIDRARVHECLT